MKRVLFLICLLSAAGALYALAPLALAQEAGFVPLVKVPGLSDGVGEGISVYLNALFRIAIVIAGILAVLMIIAGGFMYMTSEAISGKSEGRSYITSAILGLLLLLGSWLILATINPDILSFRLLLTPLENTAKFNTLGPTGPDGSTPVEVVGEAQRVKCESAKIIGSSDSGRGCYSIGIKGDTCPKGDTVRYVGADGRRIDLTDNGWVTWSTGLLDKKLTEIGRQTWCNNNFGLDDCGHPGADRVCVYRAK